MRNLSIELRMVLKRVTIGLATLYRLKSGFMMVQVAFLCLGCALLNSACANDDSSADSSQNRQHHRGSHGQGQRQGTGQGQGGLFDSPNPSGSPSPVPGQ